MFNNKFYLIIIIAVVAVASLIFWSSQNVDEVANETSAEDSSEIQVSSDEIVYFYGEECPHCQDVMKFLEENNIAEKVDFSKKEVWSDKDNQKEMVAAVEECGIDKNRVGVPFLYARGECFVGSPDVEAFFRKEAELDQ